MGRGVWFTAAVLSKETAIAIPLTLAVVRVVEGLRARPPVRSGCGARRPGSQLRRCRWRPGMAGTMPRPVTSSAIRNSSITTRRPRSTPERVLAAFVHRVLHLTAHMNMFVPVLLTIAAMMLQPRTDAEGHERPGISAPVRRSHPDSAAGECGAVQRAGRGAALPLPAADVSAGPAAGGVDVSSPGSVLAGAGGALGGGLCRRAVHQSALWIRAGRQSRLCARRSACTRPGSRSLASAFPARRCCQRGRSPMNCVVPNWAMFKQPFDVYAIDDFSAAQIARAAEEPGKYSAALVFSTKYDPPRPLLSLGPAQRGDRRALLRPASRSFARGDRPPAGRHAGVVSRRSGQGQWIGLIRFNRQFEAALDWRAPAGNGPAIEHATYNQSAVSLHFSLRFHGIWRFAARARLAIALVLAAVVTAQGQSPSEAAAATTGKAAFCWCFPLTTAPVSQAWNGFARPRRRF